MKLRLTLFPFLGEFMSEKTTFRTNLSPSCIKSVCARLLNTNESNRAIAKQVKISATTVDRLCRKN